MTISALFAKNFNSSGGVLLWHKTVVASIPGSSFLSSECNSITIGKPTFFDLEHTTTFFPRVGMFALFISSTTPRAVQGTKVFMFRHSLPMLVMWKPSTSFSGSTALQTLRSSMCGGRGSCTRMPSTAGSLFRSSTFSIRSASVVVFGSWRVLLVMPGERNGGVFFRRKTDLAILASNSVHKRKVLKKT